jgi:hypothetical protein
MLLGLSSNDTGADVTPGDLDNGAGVPNGQALVNLVDAGAGRRGELGDARDALAAEMSEAAMVDAAAIHAVFQMMTRVADSTGTPLDTFIEDMSGDIRSQLGVDELDSKRVEAR